MSEPLSLYDLLVEAELSSYYASFKSKLKLEQCQHLQFVTAADLDEIGMSKPEQRRLWKTFHRHYPPGFMGRIKKKVLQRMHSTESSSKNGKGHKLSRTASMQEPRSDQHIIPAQSIILCKQLGSGEFGQVWQAVWTPSDRTEKLQVAVKCVSAEKMTANPLDFLQEAAIMHKVAHAHIVRLFGVVLDIKTVMLVSELAPLRSLLECLRDPALKPSFTVLRICDFAQQICDGMSYLESHRLIHRDLAARNILVFSADKVKISDFGLSRSLGVGEEYYRTNFSVNLKLPIAWCAPECINFLKFTSASDVWSFAVTMWEMLTYGFQPWAGMNGAQILDAIDIPKSQRLETPDACPQEYYSLMLQCWEHDPNNRPKFQDILSVLIEIRPDRVQSIAACNDGQPDHLQYANGTLITVLNKRPVQYPDGYYWKGVLDSGRTGLFLPSNTVAHIEVEYPKLPPNFSMAQTASLTDVSNVHPKAKQKPVRKLISEPQGDVRHTGHIGLDGSCFGDIAFIDKAKLPRQVVAPTMRHETRSMSNTPLIGVRNRFESTTSESASLLPQTSEDYPTFTDLDTPDFENPLRSSLLDEVFQALDGKSDMGMSQSYMEDSSISNRTITKDKEPTSPTYSVDTTDKTRLLSTSYKNDKSTPSKPEALVRPISHADAKMLDDLTAKAQKVSSKVLVRDKLNVQEKLWQMGMAERPEHLNVTDRNKVSPAALKGKVAKTLRIRRSGSNSSSEGDKSPNGNRTFSDGLPRSANVVDQWTPEAQDAYKLLIECGRSVADQEEQPTPSPRQEEGDMSDSSDTNPLRRLRDDAGGVARSFRPGSGRGRQMQRPTPAPRFTKSKESPVKKAPPPVPPKFGIDRSNPIVEQPQVPDMRPENVDKYQLLDFVLSALDSKESKSTPQSTVPQSSKVEYADLSHPISSRPQSSVLSSLAVRRESDDVVNV